MTLNANHFSTVCPKPRKRGQGAAAQIEAHSDQGHERNRVECDLGFSNYQSRLSPSAHAYISLANFPSAYHRKSRGYTT